MLSRFLMTLLRVTQTATLSTSTLFQIDSLAAVGVTAGQHGGEGPGVRFSDRQTDRESGCN